MGDWYVVHTYSGYENKVKTGIETRIQNLEAEDEIFEVQVPMETVVEFKNTVKKTIRRVRVPGYVLVRMELTDHSWGVVRHTPGVTGFVGQDAYNPVPLRMDESSTCSCRSSKSSSRARVCLFPSPLSSPTTLWARMSA